MITIRPVRGLRSFYPSDKGPIDTYQLGYDGRVEYVSAEIKSTHVNQGLITTNYNTQCSSRR